MDNDYNEGILAQTIPPEVVETSSLCVPDDEDDKDDEDEDEIEYDPIRLAGAFHQKGTICNGFSTQFDWHGLGKKVGMCFKAVPQNISFLFGPLKYNNRLDGQVDEHEDEVCGQRLAKRG